MCDSLLLHVIVIGYMPNTDTDTDTKSDSTLDKASEMIIDMTSDTIKL